MTNPATITPAMARVRDIADQALSMPDGLTIWFRVGQYGSLKAADSAAKGYQAAFSSFRARQRRTTRVASHEPTYMRDSFVKGPYDDLACQKHWLPNDEGVKLTFIPGYTLGMDLEITDNSTDLPLEKEDPVLNRCIVIGTKFLNEDGARRRENRQFLNPLTDEEMRYVWERRPDVADTYGFGLTVVAKSRGVSEQELLTGIKTPERPASDYVSVDLADLGEDDLIMDQPEDLEPGKD